MSIVKALSSGYPSSEDVRSPLPALHIYTVPPLVFLNTIESNNKRGPVSL